MSKRTIDDAGLTNSHGSDSSGLQIAKKSKKEKKDKKERRPKFVGEVENDAENREDAEAKAARKERKRLNKLKRAEEAASSADPSGVSTPISTDSKLEDKAARRAEKSRMKALKQASKVNGRDDTSDFASTPIPEPVSSSTPAEKDTFISSYTQDPALAALPQSEVDAFLTKNFIAIQDSSSKKLRPLTKFDYLPITEPAHRRPFEAFQAPTPIQAAAWPFLFDGRDVIGVAETGSGKTMAFAVPCVQKIMKLPTNQRNKGPRAVIVSPTRELAMQSYDQIMVLAQVSGLQAVSSLNILSASF